MDSGLPKKQVPIGERDELEARIVELERSVRNLKKTEQELSLSKQFSDSLVETASAIILILDMNANIVLFNQAAESLTGYRKDDVIGKCWIDIFIPERHRDEIRGVFKLVAQRHQDVSNYENTIVTAGGEERIIEWSNSIVSGLGSSPAGVLSIGIDVTEQRRAEEKLRDSEERYRTVFESANDAILVMTGDGIVDCNGTAAKMFGYASREEMIGFRPWEISPEVQPDGRDSKVQSELYDSEALGGQPQNFCWQGCRKDGELFDTEVSLNTFLVEGEKYLVAVVRNITEIKRAENILRSAVKGTASATGARFFRSLVRHLAEGLGVRCGLVGLLEGSADKTVRTMAFWDNGRHVKNIQYDLSGTPCEEAINKGGTVCFSDVASQFPKGHILAQLGINTYVGTPLSGSTGETLGILAILHDKPILEAMTPHAVSLLSLFGVRAAAEIERLQVENDLQLAKENLQRESDALSEKNVALRQILEHMENDRIGFREELAAKIENLLLPVVEKLRANDGHLSKRDTDYVEETLKSILGREIDVFKRNIARLTNREFEISEMIRNGLSSKEIASKLAISPETVHKHRESIRDKLQIKNSHLNLGTYLKSKPWPT